MLIFFRNLEKKRRKRGLVVENKDHRAHLTKERGEPVHKLKQVDFSPAGEDWNRKYHTYIHSTRDRGSIELRRKNAFLFACTTADMPGIDPGLIMHHLNVKVSSKEAYSLIARKPYSERTFFFFFFLRMLVETG